MPLDDLTAKPDVQDVTSYHDYMERLWGTALSTMGKAYDAYFRENDIWANLRKANPDVAAQRPAYHSGKVPGMIDHAVDAHLAFEPRFHRRPAGTGQDHAEKADQVEKGLQAVFHDAFQWQTYFSTKVNGKQLSICNYTQLYVGLDLDALGAIDKDGKVRRPERNPGENLEDFQRREWEWETSRHTWNPIRIEVPQLGEVLMDPRMKTPPLALRRRKYLAYELEGLTTRKVAFVRRIRRGMAEEFRHTGDPYDEIEVLELWTPYWVHVQRKGGATLWVEPNSFGYQPFIHTFGGATDMPAGRTWDPDWYVRQSLIWPILEDAMFRDQGIVSQQNLLMRAAWAKVGYRGDAAEAAEQLRGDILSGEEADWWAEKQPNFPLHLFSQEQVLDKDMEESTFSLGVAGFATGIDTATQEIILSERRDRKFQHLIRQMDHLYSIAGSHILKLVTRMDKVYGVGLIDMGESSLKASDIDGQFHVEASFEQVDAVTLMQAKQDARIDLERGLLDEDTYQIIARRENASDIRKGIIKDMIRKMPQVLDKLVEIAMREEGFGQLADRMEAEQRIAALGIVGPDGQPIQSGGGGGHPPGATGARPPSPIGARPANGRFGGA